MDLALNNPPKLICHKTKIPNLDLSYDSLFLNCNHDKRCIITQNKKPTHTHTHTHTYIYIYIYNKNKWKDG